MTQPDMPHEKSKQDVKLFPLNTTQNLIITANSVIDLSSSLLKEENLNDKQKYNIRNIRNTGMLINEMANNIIKFSKNPVKIPVIENEYNLKSLLSDLYTIVHSRMSNKNLRLILDVNPSVPENLIGDRTNLLLILVNLSENALKFTQNGKVELKINWNNNKDNPVLIFEIEDTGIGIESHHMEKIFNSKQTGGTGLPLSRIIAESMRGEISAESEYGMGSTFKLRLQQKISQYTPVGENAAEKIEKHMFPQKDISIKPSEEKIEITHYDDVQPKKNIDKNKCIMFFENNQEYLIILETVYSDGYERIAYMKNYLINGQLDKYINELYALKSIAITLGADSLLSVIKSSISAYRKNNIEFIKSNFNTLIKKYEDTLEEIRQILSEEGVLKKIGTLHDYSAEYNHTGAMLMRISDFIDMFNASAAENEIIKLLEFENIDWIKKQVLKRTLKLLTDSCYQDVKNIVIAMARGEKL